jgi:hypothetical protein
MKLILSVFFIIIGLFSRKIECKYCHKKIFLFFLWFHKKHCLFNPKSKACYTCKFYRTVEENEGDKSWYTDTCDKYNIISDISYPCKFWEVKN